MTFSDSLEQLIKEIIERPKVAADPSWNEKLEYWQGCLARMAGKEGKNIRDDVTEIGEHSLRRGEVRHLLSLSRSSTGSHASAVIGFQQVNSSHCASNQRE